MIDENFRRYWDERPGELEHLRKDLDRRYRESIKQMVDCQRIGQTPDGFDAYRYGNVFVVIDNLGPMPQIIRSKIISVRG